MAIIIPSKQIYEVNNSKVLKNALKTIESSQIKNEFIFVDNPNPISKEIQTEPLFATGDQKSSRILPDALYGKNYKFCASLKSNINWGKAEVSFSRNITGEDSKDSFYLSEITPTIKTEYDLTISTVMAESYLINPEEYVVNEIEFTDDSQEYSSRQVSASDYSYGLSLTNLDVDYSFKNETNLSIKPEFITLVHSVLKSGTIGNDEDRQAGLISLTLDLDKEYPFKITYTENRDSYDFNVIMATDFTVWFGYDAMPRSEVSSGVATKPITAQKLDFKLKKAELVINEKIKKIKTTQEEYLYTNPVAYGEEAFAVGDNPFLRTETRYNGAENAPKYLLQDTLRLYTRGKETATIRCSIGDYFSDTGEKIVSVDSPQKMVFDHYDEVIPMFKNDLGMDEPIAYNHDGLAKTFEVVGVKFVFDGAVWQELTLREKGAIAYKLTLPKPQLYLSENTLEVSEPSGLATTFEIYVDGRFAKLITKDMKLDLSELYLKHGNHKITAVSCNPDYNTSEKSRSVNYYVAPQVRYYIEKNESGGYTYHITADEYKVVDGTIVIGD